MSSVVEGFSSRAVPTSGRVKEGKFASKWSQVVNDVSQGVIQGQKASVNGVQDDRGKMRILGSVHKAHQMA